MAPRKKASKSQQAASTGTSALVAGDYETAARMLGQAVETDRRNPGIRVNLGLALQQLGGIDAAASQMCEALALAPDMIDAARPFQALVRRYAIAETENLNPIGLKAALNFTVLDRQPLVELAIDHAMQQPGLAVALVRVREGDAVGAATALLVKRTAKELSNDVLILALQRGKNTDPNVERLLTALRRVLLMDVPLERFSEDRKLFTLLLALAAQSIRNEYVWGCERDEYEALDKLPLDLERLLAGDAGQARALGLKLLYEPLSQIGLAQATAKDIAKLKPKAIAALLEPLVVARTREIELAKTIKRLGTVADTTSLKVAAQYETSPYPRWSGIHVSQPGALRHGLQRYFTDDWLQFMDAPFDVLIAGCGTGQQAAIAATSYGPNASVLGIDISIPSLAYAQRACDDFGLDQMTFAQCDILDAAKLDKQFDVIECIGVLHHMKDPFDGWRFLIDALKPGGIMYIGLYSAISRKGIASLRDEPEYPGPGCSDKDARAYRQNIMARDGAEPGAILVGSQDFYSLSEFRDLVLHESEQQMTLPQISTFLDDAGLVFRGFMIDPHYIEHYESQYPDDPFPGSLANWADLETQQTSLFDGMYLFWCEKVP